ncbi:MAG: hypothetical protein ACRDH5_03360, partial [bacterium]
EPWRAAWTGFLQAAKEIAERGTCTSLAHAVPFADVNGSFRSERPARSFKCVFRTIAISDSGGRRSLIPGQGDRSFRAS